MAAKSKSQKSSKPARPDLGPAPTLPKPTEPVVPEPSKPVVPEIEPTPTVVVVPAVEDGKKILSTTSAEEVVEIKEKTSLREGKLVARCSGGGLRIYPEDTPAQRQRAARQLGSLLLGFTNDEVD